MCILLYHTLGYCSSFFFFNDTATTEIYTLSLHDALPILFGMVTLVSVAICFGVIDTRSVPEPDDPAIAYATEPTTDRVAVLNREIDAGKVRLRFGGEQGYLRSALDALRVPIESQMVVFSKISVQAQRINPQNPRTLFFNDSVAIGWIRSAFIDVASHY